MKELKAKLKRLSIFCFSLLLLFFVLFGFRTYGGGEKMVIGAKNCTESHILGEILAQMIERKTDLKVVRKFNLEGTSICFEALRSHTIDAYVEYTGTAVLEILKEPLPKEGLFEYLQEVFEDRYGMYWLDRLGFSNQYVLITRKELLIDRISQLQEHPELRLAVDPEFASRVESSLLNQNYQNTSHTKLMDQVLLYFSLKSGGIDVISGFSTDGRLFDPEFVTLVDDRTCLPTYEAAPLITKQSLQKHPQIAGVFAMLKGAITTETMSRLNYRVEIEGEDVGEVARHFIQQQGL